MSANQNGAGQNGAGQNSIDDVLAAIRILVMAPPQACDMRTGNSEKLVLGPAQRIGAPSSPPGMQPGAAPLPFAVSAPDDAAGDGAAGGDAAGDEEEEEIVLDEDALRNLVVKVLREELQGEFGERVSRNVRKLVQREVRLALSRLELE